MALWSSTGWATTDITIESAAIVGCAKQGGNQLYSKDNTHAPVDKRLIHLNLSKTVTEIFVTQHYLTTDEAELTTAFWEIFRVMLAFVSGYRWKTTWSTYSFFIVKTLHGVKVFKYRLPFVTVVSILVRVTSFPVTKLFLHICGFTKILFDYLPQTLDISRDIYQFLISVRTLRESKAASATFAVHMPRFMGEPSAGVRFKRTFIDILHLTIEYGWRQQQAQTYWRKGSELYAHTVELRSVYLDVLHDVLNYAIQKLTKLTVVLTY
jgi:hypothetical protein